MVAVQGVVTEQTDRDAAPVPDQLTQLITSLGNSELALLEIIILGVLNLSDFAVETPATVAERIRKALPFVPAERIVCTASSSGRRSRCSRVSSAMALAPRRFASADGRHFPRM